MHLAHIPVRGRDTHTPVMCMERLHSSCADWNRGKGVYLLEGTGVAPHAQPHNTTHTQQGDFAQKCMEVRIKGASRPHNTWLWSGTVLTHSVAQSEGTIPQTQI
eukprot:TRINITY_DN14175_c5_g1_i1.p2 TRINITY_DN14175_c5_g1~~TRINITY_DN14175_c5_g1_i1.p2  ORF type:complete len:104 (-),score=2.35 TRINITY_DN14175_c5_g1_i1:294-605(-)